MLPRDRSPYHPDTAMIFRSPNVRSPALIPSPDVGHILTALRTRADMPKRKRAQPDTDASDQLDTRLLPQVDPPHVLLTRLLLTSPRKGITGSAPMLIPFLTMR